MKPNDGNVNMIQRSIAFSERLRAARRAAGKDQTEFGAIGGVSRGAQSNYEKGDRTPDVDYLLRIAESGIDICELLTGVPTETPAFSAAELELMALLRSVTPEIRAAVETILRSCGGSGTAWSANSLHDEATSFAQDGDKR